MSNRWHDRQEDLSIMIKLLEELPEELRDVIISAIDGRMESKWETNELLKSLGTEKILAFHKSKNKKRSYDQDPKLHKTVNHFFLLPEKEQRLLARESLQLTKEVVEYIANCQNHHRVPSGDELKEMTRIFITRGYPYVHQYISDKYPEFQFSEKVIGNEEGMRVQSEKKERRD